MTTKHGVTPFVFLNVESTEEQVGTSRANKAEAAVTADAVSLSLTLALALALTLTLALALTLTRTRRARSTWSSRRRATR